MKLSSFLVLFVLSATTIQLRAQQDIHDVLSNARSFDMAVEQAETYFTTKHGDYHANDLCTGEHRDGEFVKFKRWEAFWSERLNPDGTLGDITAYHRNSGPAERGNTFENIDWTNLSYENYIDMQIGLGRTTSIGFHPTDADIFYVGAAIGGLWKTTDGGANYEPIADELPFLAISSVVVNADNPEEIYVALSDHVWYGPPSIGVYKTSDGGDTWEATALSFEFSENVRIYWMIAAPNDASTMFVGTDDGLYRTSDGFDTVEQINGVVTSDIKFNPNDASIVYQGATNGNFYRSTDGGTDFELIDDLGQGAVMIAVTPLDPNKVYARSGNLLKRSTDAGLNFDGSLAQVPDNGGVLMFSPQDDEVLLSGWFDVWLSENDGDNFTQITHWLNDGGLPDIHVDQRNVFVNPLDENHIYLCNDGGVYKFNVNDHSFTNLSHGLMITQFYDIAVAQSDPNVIGGGSQDNGNVFRNSEGEWEEYAGTGDGMNQEIDPTNAGIRYWSYQLGGMRRYVSGNNAPIAPPGQDGNGAWETPYKLDQSFPDRIICAFDKVYESWTQGNTWEDISESLDGNSDMQQLAIAPSNGNRIYVARAGKIWVKDVLSNDWEEKSLPANSLSDLEVDHVNMDLIYVSVPGYTNGSKVYRSMDAGDSWENISGSLPNVSTGSVETYKMVSGGLFVGTDAGVFYRDDTFDDWELYGDLPNTRVEDIEIQYAAQKIRIGTHGRGVLEADVNIGLCEDNDADSDGICDDYDICPGFDDGLLGTPCNDGNPDTVDDVYVGCDECEGILNVSITELAHQSFAVYPNPTSGLFNVNNPGITEGIIHVYNPQGQLVITKQLLANTLFDLSDYAKGVYMVKILDKTGAVLGVEKIQIN